MVSSEEIRAETRRVLDEANLDETSGRVIREKVAKALKLSKEHISSFRPIIEVQLVLGGLKSMLFLEFL